MERKTTYVYSRLLKEQLQLVKTKRILEKMLTNINDNLNAALVEQMQLVSSQGSTSTSSATEPIPEPPAEVTYSSDVKNIIKETLNLEVYSVTHLDEENEEESD